jgi:hypothetical protein
MTLDRPPPEKTMSGGFWIKHPYMAPLTSESRSDFPNQPLLSSVPTVDMSASCGVLGLSRWYSASIGGRGPHAS